MMSTNSLHHNAITSCLERLQRDFAVSEKSDTLKYDRSDELQDTYHCTLLFLTYVDVSAYCKPKLKHLNYQGITISQYNWIYNAIFIIQIQKR